MREGNVNMWRIGVRRILAMAALVLLVGGGRGFGEDCSESGSTPCGTDTCGSTTWTLWAGQTIDVGSVTVCNDGTNVYVNYTLDYEGASFGTLHLWMGDTLANVPANSQGTPVPGQFCSATGGRCEDTNGATCWNFTVPLAEIGITNVTEACNTILYVVTHAEVTLPDDDDLDTDPEHETAFGGDTEGSGSRWWFYGAYTVCCDFDTPVSFCETAYGYGTHVWTTDKKSNPDGLPSLKLTKNRWGWAINMTEPGTYSSTIWAGAGLNKTGNGMEVGTLTVVWDGTTDAVTVTYNLDVGCLKEVHVYVGDDAPDTIAPGQYGIIDSEFDDNTTYTTTVEDVEDTGGGIWIVAHAVVCSECE